MPILFSTSPFFILHSMEVDFLLFSYCAISVYDSIERGITHTHTHKETREEKKRKEKESDREWHERTFTWVFSHYYLSFILYFCSQYALLFVVFRSILVLLVAIVLLFCLEGISIIYNENHWHGDKLIALMIYKCQTLWIIFDKTWLSVDEQWLSTLVYVCMRFLYRDLRITHTNTYIKAKAKEGRNEKKNESERANNSELSLISCWHWCKIPWPC